MWPVTLVAGHEDVACHVGDFTPRMTDHPLVGPPPPSLFRCTRGDGVWRSTCTIPDIFPEPEPDYMATESMSITPRPG
jgi:hypothetical protein